MDSMASGYLAQKAQSEAEIEKLHAKIGHMLVERDRRCNAAVLWAQQADRI